jgi:hypothetical protein
MTPNYLTATSRFTNQERWGVWIAITATLWFLDMLVNEALVITNYIFKKLNHEVCRIIGIPT